MAEYLYPFKPINLTLLGIQLKIAGVKKELSSIFKSEDEQSNSLIFRGTLTSAEKTTCDVVYANHRDVPIRELGEFFRMRIGADKVLFHGEKQGVEYVLKGTKIE